jgi:hypothetical protein
MLLSAKGCIHILVYIKVELHFTMLLLMTTFKK